MWTRYGGRDEDDDDEVDNFSDQRYDYEDYRQPLHRDHSKRYPQHQQHKYQYVNSERDLTLPLQKHKNIQPMYESPEEGIIRSI